MPLKNLSVFYIHNIPKRLMEKIHNFIDGITVIERSLKLFKLVNYYVICGFLWYKV